MIAHHIDPILAVNDDPQLETKERGCAVLTLLAQMPNVVVSEYDIDLVNGVCSSTCNEYCLLVA